MVKAQRTDALGRFEKQQHQVKRSLKPTKPANMVGPKRPATAGPQGRALKVSLKKRELSNSAGPLGGRPAMQPSVSTKKGATNPFVSHLPGFSTAKADGKPAACNPVNKMKRAGAFAFTSGKARCRQQAEPAGAFIQHPCA